MVVSRFVVPVSHLYRCVPWHGCVQVLLVAGPDKGKTGYMIGVEGANSSMKAIIKLETSASLGIREIKVRRRVPCPLRCPLSPTVVAFVLSLLLLLFLLYYLEAYYRALI